MKTKKVYIILAMLLPLFLVGCSIDSLVPQTNTNKTNNTPQVSQTQSDTTKEEQIQKDITLTRKYENKQENFSLNFLSGREFQENKYGFNTIIFAPKDDDIKENVGISVQHLQKFLSVQEYYEETINNLKNKFNDFKEIEQQDIQKGSLKGKTITYTYTQGNNTIKTQETFLISPENTVYIINYTATKATFDKYTNGVNTIIESFTSLD